ncbi:MAG TPA: RsmD family RNA methyltransferase [Candidatus Saccharimonadales bacterium]|nr:RsmD family RNA methyltransferase [Candidatus Saccharimonadales bacterium]
MRIIAGRLGGRTFDSPGTQRTHPMSDKMRGALFNMLGDIAGLTVLDAFTGTGALAFEAISRGAVSALLCESDRSAQKTIAQNMQTLGVDTQAKLIRASVQAWLQTSSGAQFDIVLCDPPYDDLQPALLARLAACVMPGGLLVLSWPGSEALPKLPGLAQVEQRGYGDGQLAFYRRIG